MIFVEPEQGVADQEALHFVRTVVEPTSVPVRLFTLPWVPVFVEMRSIEIAETRLIFREVGRNPIKDDADPVLGKTVHKIPEIVWRTDPAGRRKVNSGLISPGAIERMLHNWQQFDVSETGLPNVIRQEWRHLPISQPAIPFVKHPPPGA